MDLRTPYGEVDGVFLPLHGEHQADNAAVALTAAEAFFDRGLDHELVRDAFGAVTVPGRFEVAQHDPTVVLDAAHNLDGARAFATTVREELTMSGTVIMVAGFLRGRDPAEMLEALGAVESGFLVACTPNSPRAIPASEVAAAATGLGIVAEVIPSVDDAMHRALAVAGPDDLVLVTGSLYVVGPARTLLRAEVDA